MPGKDEIKELLKVDLESLCRLAPFKDSELVLPEIFLGKKLENGPPQSLHDLVGESLRLQRLDAALKNANVSSIVNGPPLSKRLRQMMPAERTSYYKLSVSKGYASAIHQARDMFLGIESGKIKSISMAQNMVKSFMGILVKDRNLLLNMVHSEILDEDPLYNHSVNTCLLSMAIGAASGLSHDQVFEIGLGALMADVGMMTIPRQLRLKPSKLTPGELYEIRRHPLLSIGMLEKLQGISENVLQIAYQHHERPNGIGYPRNRKGSEIHHWAKMVSVADSYAAMIHTRSHRPSFPPYQAMERVIRMGGGQILDPYFIRSFLSYMSLFPMGSLVKLSSGRIGKVIHSHSRSVTAPIVSILAEKTGTEVNSSSAYQLDLLLNNADFVVEALANNAIRHDLLDGF